MRIGTYAIGGTIWLAACVVALSETSAEPPLPSIETVIQRAVDAAQGGSDNDRAFNQRYFYARAKVTEFRNGDGELKKQEKKQNVNDPARQAARPVVPQPAPQANAVTPSGAGQAPTANVRGRAFDKKDFLANPDLLDRFVLVLKGRESVNGRDALVIDFKPKAGKLPERNLKERFINRAAGRIWLDEEESQLVKADLHLTEKVDVLGGLVGSVWKFNCSIDRERTDDGLWFTRATSWHLEGREVVLRRTVDYHEQTTDLRRMR